MVIDTSALLAVLFDEPPATWVRQQLVDNAADLHMSTVNLAETLIILRDRRPTGARAAEAWLLRGDIAFAAPSTDEARVAAHARLRFLLNLGDCFAYALARTRGLPLLTLDTDFRRTDVSVVTPP